MRRDGPDADERTLEYARPGRGRTRMEIRPGPAAIGCAAAVVSLHLCFFAGASIVLLVRQPEDAGVDSIALFVSFGVGILLAWSAWRWMREAIRYEDGPRAPSAAAATPGSEDEEPEEKKA